MKILLKIHESTIVFKVSNRCNISTFESLIKADKYFLVFNGRILSNYQEMTLKECGVRNNSTIYIIPRTYGGIFSGLNSAATVINTAVTSALTATGMAFDKVQNVATSIYKKGRDMWERAHRLRAFIWAVQAFAQFIATTIRISAIFFVIVVVFRMIIGFFEAPIEFIMLAFSCVYLPILFVIYYIFYIPPFFQLLFLVWFIIMDVIPLLAYTVLYGAIFLIITLIIMLLSIVNFISCGKLNKMTLCQNSPKGWYTTPNYQLMNKYQRGILCSKPCLIGYHPDETTDVCVKSPPGFPSFCPQSQVMRVYSNESNTMDRKFTFQQYETKTSYKYGKSAPENREHLLKDFYLKKYKYLDICRENLQHYEFLPLTICSSLEMLQNNGLDSKQINKLKLACRQSFCSGNSNYTFCQNLDPTDGDTDKNYWVRIIKIVLMMIVFVLIVQSLTEGMNGYK